MSQLRKEDFKKPKKHPFSLTKLTSQSIITNFGSAAINDIDFSSCLDREEEMQYAFTKLMNEEQLKNSQCSSLQRPGTIEYIDRARFLSQTSLNTYDYGSTSSSSGSYHANLINRPINYGNQICASPDNLQGHAQMLVPLNYATPYFIKTCNYFPTPVYYQQHFVYPQPVPICLSNPISINSNQIEKETVKAPKSRKYRIKEKELEALSNQVSQHSETDEDIDIVHDFIVKCPSHLDFIIKNKLEAGRLLSSVTFNNATSLFKCLKKDIDKLMVDNYGNYFLQELLRFLNIKERLKVWKIIKNNVCYYGTHQYAHHVLQFLIELSVEKEQQNINEILLPFFETLLLDAKGSHIIQKIITYFNETSKKDLVQFMLSNFISIITNIQGVCSVKKFIKSVSLENSQSQVQFYQQIISNLPSLVNEKSAHYALLCIFEEWSENSFKEILDHLVENFLSYSTLKYASRLIEKCLLIENKVSPLH